MMVLWDVGKLLCLLYRREVKRKIGRAVGGLLVGRFRQRHPRTRPRRAYLFLPPVTNNFTPCRLRLFFCRPRLSSMIPNNPDPAYALPELHTLWPPLCMYHF